MVSRRSALAPDGILGPAERAPLTCDQIPQGRNQRLLAGRALALTATVALGHSNTLRAPLVRFRW